MKIKDGGVRKTGSPRKNLKGAQVNSKQYLLVTTGIVCGFASTTLSAQTTPASDSQLEEVQVTGYRASLDAAQSLKKDSAEVIEAIAPEDLGKFTDNSIAGALQRLPGVEVDQNTDGRTGDHVSIRGIGSEYVTTTVNGRTPLGYGYEGMTELREFPIDIFPTEVLSGAVVYKTPSANRSSPVLPGPWTCKPSGPWTRRRKTAAIILAR